MSNVMATPMLQAQEGTSDQTKFWSSVIQQINGAAGIQLTDNTLIASKSIRCAFGDKVDDANQQLVQLGNTIPAWSLTWPGILNNSFFGMYQSFLDEIHPTPATPPTADDQTQLDSIKQSILGLMSGVDQIRLATYKNWLNDNCLVLGADKVSCTTWVPGVDETTFKSFWTEYQRGQDFKEKVAVLEQQFGGDLNGLHDRYAQLAEKVYGPDYREIAEAQAAMQKADPKNFNNRFDKNDPRATYQVQVNEGGVEIWVPRFTLQGSTFADFRKWFATAKAAAAAGQDPEVEVVLSNSIQTQDSSSWKFVAGASIPVEDFFMIGARASGSHSTLDVSRYDFTARLTYQAVRHFPIGPVDSWYDASMLTKYRNYSGFSATSPFAKRSLWGPQGVFNLRVAGVIVGYQPWLKMEVANWTQSEAHTTWSEEADFSILGLIHLGSESASGQSDHVQYTSTDQGFELRDTSGDPQIVALVVETLNYP